MLGVASLAAPDKPRRFRSSGDRSSAGLNTLTSFDRFGRYQDASLCGLDHSVLRTGIQEFVTTQESDGLSRRVNSGYFGPEIVFWAGISTQRIEPAGEFHQLEVYFNEPP